MPPVDVYSALANPVRRKLLEGLMGGARAAGDLAGEFSLSRPAVSEHLSVLKKAGLVREEPRGRHRYYHLQPEPLAEVGAWLHPFEHYWRARMGALSDVLDEITIGAGTGSNTSTGAGAGSTSTSKDGSP
ncbi:ArsR/SmtB family transcription factor [Streptomyces cyaneus]|uniref:ArsR/SmtB family transcription factor n=1 Tax=Streptomyces cyaneus TaxID=1904 RepID=UPI000FF8ACE3|nr:metalloregulator ArsR/SmtB family transcription factor [Streptomyces cyaneus]